MGRITLVNVGYGNMIAAARVIAVVASDSAPVKRMMQEAKESGKAIDATCGRKTRTVIIMDDGHVVLSSVMPETVGNRISGSKEEETE